MRFLAAFAAFAVAQTAAPDLRGQTHHEIDSVIAREMKRRGIPGLSYAVLDHGAIAARGAHGIANLETQSPVTTNSVFELASLTKQFTAAGIMMLVEDGKVRLDDPISMPAAALEQMWTPVRLASGEDAWPAYGFGFNLSEMRGIALPNMPEHPERFSCTSSTIPSPSLFSQTSTRAAVRTPSRSHG